MDTTGKDFSDFLQTVKTISNQDGMPAMLVAWGEREATIGAAKALAIELGGLSVRANATWTMAAMLADIWGEMGGRRLGTRAAMHEGIIKNLTDQPRPLAIWEADYLFKRQDMFDALYDICELAGRPVVMIGSEDFARKLRANERLSRRVSAWVDLTPQTAD